ncbi:hypothetical protein [uncultured Sulfitobacter sp.]|uniref:hypothetical protein n=1 Tax=uncultured Sulfitobacter sp. TaxID=191468 RepID=UPI002591A0A1|nr:hypothetical protein [uncultured Sulfitobacter sp.]
MTKRIRNMTGALVRLRLFIFWGPILWSWVNVYAYKSSGSHYGYGYKKRKTVWRTARPGEVQFALEIQERMNVIGRRRLHELYRMRAKQYEREARLNG